MNRDDFDNYSDLSRYWLKEDALRSLDYDVYFSLGKRYHCDAGCQVCYIKDNLADTKLAVDTLFPTVFMDSVWNSVFEYFGVIRTNDDLFYLKHNLPKHYEWYQQNGKQFEFCLTDNALFRTINLDISLKTLGDVTISTDFLEKVGVEKVISLLRELYEKFGIKKIKYIDCGNPSILKEVIKFTEEYKLHNCVHHDFRTNDRSILDQTYAEYQNTWVINDNIGLMQIYRESLHLYYDGFFFSSDDASNMIAEPFYTIDNMFDYKKLIINMLRSKQAQYKIWKDRVNYRKFKEYYNTTLDYKINDDFTFIPAIMYPNSAKFFYRLEQEGWTRTPYGMISSTSNIIPLIEKK
jgi:hypothetical protein